VVISLFDGSFPVVMSIDFGFVDVRDVANAHVLAFERQNAKGRYICFGHKFSMRELIDQLRKVTPDLGMTEGLPTKHADCGPGDVFIKFFANFQESGVKDFLKLQVGKKLQWDCSKIEKDLGITWRSAEETLRDTVVDLAKKGLIKPKKEKK